MNKKVTSRWLSFCARLIICVVWVVIFMCVLYGARAFDRFMYDPKKLYVIAFTDLISHESLVRFKERTGIKVKITHVENDDELLSKLKISNGEGYDIAIARDHMVQLLHQDKLLKRLDLSKISCFKDVDTRLVGHYFDPYNNYSVPFSWVIFGVGYNKKHFKGEIEDITWNLIFNDPKQEGLDYEICMINDMRDAVFLTSLHLFGKTSGLSKHQLVAIRNALIRQKRWVESYAEDQVDYLLFTEAVPLAVIPSSYMRIIFREQSEDFAFAIPREGSLMYIENCVIPSSSTKSEAAHEFINFLLSEEIVALNCNRYGLYPVNTKVYQYLDKDLFAKLGFPPSEAVLKKSGILRNDIPLRQLEDLWIAVKAA